MLYPTTQEVLEERDRSSSSLWEAKKALLDRNILDWLSEPRTTDELRTLLIFLLGEGRL